MKILIGLKSGRYETLNILIRNNIIKVKGSVHEMSNIL